MANRVARIASLPGLLLLVNAAAWAGRGDVDPNYGDGGRVSRPNGTVLALPGDRLVILEVTGEGLRVRMVDATGQLGLIQAHVETDPLRGVARLVVQGHERQI